MMMPAMAARGDARERHGDAAVLRFLTKNNQRQRCRFMPYAFAIRRRHYLRRRLARCAARYAVREP
jgi:hypothetical protein